MELEEVQDGSIGSSGPTSSHLHQIYSYMWNNSCWKRAENLAEQTPPQKGIKEPHQDGEKMQKDRVLPKTPPLA